MNISKLDAAVHQLGVAIHMFFQGDFLSAVTLAGAAEEILGSLSKHAGKPVAIDEIAKFHLKDVIETIPEDKRRTVLVNVLNRGRNQAKHANAVDESYVEVDQIWPLQMIMRAMPMAKNLGAEVPYEVEMLEWMRAHPEAFQ